MEQGFSGENNLETEIRWKRLPVTVEVDGEMKNIWVRYRNILETKEGLCCKCGKVASSPCEAVAEVHVESDNQSISERASEKIKLLIDEVEKKMFVCSDCYDDAFVQERPQFYINTLEQVQKDFGIVIDQDEQRKRILG